MTQHTNTGVSGLNPLLAGGYLSERTTVITGDTGTGKTLLGLQFLYSGLCQNETGVLVTLDQPASQIIADGQAIGLDLSHYLDKGQLTVLDLTHYFSGLTQLESTGIGYVNVIDDIYKFIKKKQANRVVIDPIAPLIFHDSINLSVIEFLRKFMIMLDSKLSVTGLVIAQDTGLFHGYLHWITVAASAIIKLRMKTLNERHLVIKKMRGTALTHTTIPIGINSDIGLHVATL